MSYVTTAGREAVKRYQYRGCDRSLLYRFALGPLAQTLVDTLTPTWLAPNTITLAGLVAQVVALTVMYANSDDFNTPPPGWTGLVAAICLFVYSTLDNMDGKQARRTGSSSALGLLFDHGCDAINAGLLGPLILSSAIGAGNASVRMLVIWACATVPFFMNTWEEYHLQEFILPVVNGPNEGLMLLCTFFAATAMYGPGMWAAPAPTWDTATGWSLPLAALNSGLAPVVGWIRWLEGSHAGAPTQLASGSAPVHAPTSLIELTVAAFTVAVTLTVIVNTINVLHHVLTREGGSIASVVRAVVRQVPLWLTLALTYLWMRTPGAQDAARRHPYMFFFTAGCLFVDFTCKLMISHACEQHYAPFYGGLALYAAWPLARAMLGESPLGVSADVALFASFTLNAASLALFVYESLADIASALDVDLFDITKQRRRAGKL